MTLDITAARSAREAFRAGRIAPSAGLAPGFTQCNMIPLPKDWARDFLLYAQRNPKACPVLDVTEAGSRETALAQGADLRRDLPLYRIWRDGRLEAEVPDASAAWADHPGNPVQIREGEVPVFWACGVTPQAAVMASGVPFAITHAPGLCS